MANNVLTTVEMESPPRVNELRRFFRVFFGRKLVLFGSIVILLTVLTAIFAPLIAPYDPDTPDVDHILAQPGMEHWLGTDLAGRDLLSRVIYGTRFSLIIGLSVSAAAAVTGMILGMAAGYFGGWIYNIIMRSIDGLMAFPMILEALVIATLLGGGMRNVVIALSIGLLPTYARLMCGQVLSVKEQDYVLAGRSIGAGNLRIMLRHIFPNTFPPILVMATMMLGATVLAEASLSFLGIGIDPQAPSWGGMINSGHDNLVTNPILSLAPGVALMLVVFAFNMVGDGLRDALDPKLRGTF